MRLVFLTFTSTIWENQVSYALGLDSNDVVIAISNSGESSQVLAVCKEMKSGVCLRLELRIMRIQWLPKNVYIIFRLRREKKALFK